MNLKDCDAVWLQKISPALNMISGNYNHILKVVIMRYT